MLRHCRIASASAAMTEHCPPDDLKFEICSELATTLNLKFRQGCSSEAALASPGSAEPQLGIADGDAKLGLGARVIMTIYNPISENLIATEPGTGGEANGNCVAVRRGPTNTLPSLVCLAWKQLNAKPSASVME